MNKQILKSILGLLIIFVTSCYSVNDSQLTLNVTTTKIIVPDSLTVNALGSMYPFIAESFDHKYLAIANYRNPVNVVVLDSEGQFVTVVGQNGRGPGEIQSARFFGFDGENKFVIYDKTLATIKTFDLFDKENVVSNYSPPQYSGIDIFSNIFQKCNDKWILAVHKLDPNELQSVDIIGVYDKDFVQLDSFGQRDEIFEENVSVNQAPIIYTDCESSITYTSHAKIPFIQIFDLESKNLLDRIEFIPPSFNLSKQTISEVKDVNKMREFMIEKQSATKFITTDSTNIYVIFRNDTKKFYQTYNYWDRDFYVAAFSKKTKEFIGEAKLPGAIMGTSNNGELIAMVEDDNGFKINYLKIESL